MNIQTAPWILFLKATDADKPLAEPVAFDLKIKLTPESMSDFVNKNMAGEIVPGAAPKSKRAIMITSAILLVGALVLAVTGKLSAVIYNPWIAMTFSIVHLFTKTCPYSS